MGRSPRGVAKSWGSMFVPAPMCQMPCDQMARRIKLREFERTDPDRYRCPPEDTDCAGAFVWAGVAGGVLDAGGRAASAAAAAAVVLTAVSAGGVESSAIFTGRCRFNTSFHNA